MVDLVDSEISDQGKQSREAKESMNYTVSLISATDISLRELIVIC